MGPSATSMPPTLSRGIEKSLFQISANRLEVDESVNKAHFRIHGDAMNNCKAFDNLKVITTIVIGSVDHHTYVLWSICFHSFGALAKDVHCITSQPTNLS